ncbi:hypothetical protein JM654_18555 [Microbacterium oxydans]|nr:hypothetical protein [Microbacterium oxydans]
MLAARAETRVADLVAAELARTSDVSRPPLLHAHVVRSGRSSAVLVLGAHHLVIDGWSTPLLIERVAAAAAGQSVADGWGRSPSHPRRPAGGGPGTGARRMGRAPRRPRRPHARRSRDAERR